MYFSSLSSEFANCNQRLNRRNQGQIGEYLIICPGYFDDSELLMDYTAMVTKRRWATLY